MNPVGRFMVHHNIWWTLTSVAPECQVGIVPLLLKLMNKERLLDQDIRESCRWWGRYMMERAEYPVEERLCLYYLHSCYSHCYSPLFCFTPRNKNLSSLIKRGTDVRMYSVWYRLMYVLRDCQGSNHSVTSSRILFLRKAIAGHLGRFGISFPNWESALWSHVMQNSLSNPCRTWTD